jgi:multidrug resistance efflux pump
MSFAAFRTGSFSVCLLATLSLFAGAQQLPTKGPSEDLESDASHLLNDLPTLTDPGISATDGQKFTVEQAKARLVQTQHKLQKWEKLFKDGVLSQSEVERCTVELADALARYEHANLEELRRQLAAVMERAGQGGVDQALIDAAKAGVASAQDSAAKADAQLFQTKFDLAKVNLERQRRLYEEKLISKAAMEDAAALVQRLAAQKASHD